MALNRPATLTGGAIRSPSADRRLGNPYAFRLELEAQG